MPSSFFLTDMTFDPDLSEAVTIYRSSGQFAAGGWQNTVTNIAANGTITVADADALAMIPEGDRVAGSLQFVCPQAVYETLANQGGSGNPGLSDQISWNGNNYRVQNVQLWSRYGIWVAILVRMTGE